MNEAETRAEHIDPALAAAGWGVVDGSRILREYPITLGRLEGQGRRAKGLQADYVLVYRNRKLACELSVRMRSYDRKARAQVACGLVCTCLQVIIGGFHSDEELAPFEMFAGGCRPASRKALVQQCEVSDFICLHQDPVGQGTTTGAANLIRQ